MIFKEYLQYLDKYVTTHYGVRIDSINWYIDQKNTYICVTLEYDGDLVHKVINYNQFEQFCKGALEG